MPQSDITAWLNFAIQQMAAESYLDNINLASRSDVEAALIRGNNRLGFSTDNKTRMTDALATRFFDMYQLVDHHANDATGFSATLIKDLSDPTGKTFTLSFRSSEYQNQIAGGDWERDGVAAADGEIGRYGFALAQLVSMEKYYRELKANPLKLPTGAVLNVTGYSLGGHLATVFTELHEAEIAGTYTFNGAGRGTIVEHGQLGQPEVQSIRRMIQDLEARIQTFDPTGDLFHSGSLGNIYQDDRYQTALIDTRLVFTTVGTAATGSLAIDQGAFAKITQLHGRAVTGSDFEFVANSGIHTTPTSVLIEGQPIREGRDEQGQLQFGNAHSLTLLVDSLALMDVFHTIDPQRTQAELEAIFKASSDATARTVVSSPDTPNAAEGDTLEKSLDALRKLFLGPTLTPPTLPVDSRGGGFGNLANRNEFYNGIAAVHAMLAGQTYQITSLVNMPIETIKGNAVLPGATGLAYRYALKELNPFVVMGANYSQFYNPGDLDLYDPITGNGLITLEYLKDRATFLTNKLSINTSAFPSVRDAAISGSSFTYYRDSQSQYEIGSSAVSMPQMIFGNATDEMIDGSLIWGDRLYGGDGQDTINGEGGSDYIEGNEGNDVLLSGGSGTDTILGGQGDDLLDGGTGNDTLDGGLDNDIMRGGAGLDRYISNFGADTIEDSDGRGVVEFHGTEVLLSGLRRTDDPANVFHSADRTITLTKSGADLVVTGSGPLTIKNFSSGHLGIRLVEEGSYAAVTRTEFQKIDHYIQVGNAPNGDPIYEPVYAAFFDDNANDTRSTAPIGGLVPEIDDRNNLIHAGGGNDTVITTAGDDQVYGEGGDDSLAGQGGHDRLYGGIGHDTINGDDVGTLVGGNDYLDGGEGDDVLLGHAGADILIAGGGNDHLEGDDQESLTIGNYGGDYLDGGDGQDNVHGVGGSDVLIGGAGNDFLLGDAAISQGGMPEAGGADSLDGGSGDDYLDGQFGEDVLAGGLDNDTLNGGDGSDALYGGDGNDMLSGDLRLLQISGLYNMADHRGAGDSDVLIGGAGFDYLTGGEGADTLFGDEGDDILVGDYDPLRTPFEARAILLNLGGDDDIDGGQGNDSLKGGVGDDRLDGGIGNDALDGGAGFDSLVGGVGDDVLEGGEGDDLLDGGEGSDVLDGGPGSDIVRAGAGEDRLMAGMGNDTLYGEEGNDELISGNEHFETGSSVLVGGSGNDRYVVDSAADTVLEEAAAGVDTIRAFVSYTLPDHVENLSLIGGPLTATGNGLANELRGSTDSILDGLGGNDQLLNGRWYRFGHGYDHDTIVENDSSGAPYFPDGVADAVQFTADVTPDQVRWQRQGIDLVLSLDGMSDTLIIPSFYTVAFNQGNYFFSSNIVLPAQTLVLGGNPYYVAPSQIERFEFADGTVWGVEAFDATMLGAYYANTYAFGLGDGQDTILDFDFTGEQPADVLQIKAGVSPDGVILRRVGDDLVLGFEGTTDQLTAQSHFASVFVRFLNFSGRFLNTYQIEQIQFADGMVWDAAAITNQLTDFVGTATADIFRGNARANTMQSLGGNDWLESFGDDDLLDGGAGNDTLLGGDGSDTYLFGRGSGSDLVEDGNVSGFDLNRICLSDTVLPTDVMLQAATNGDLLLKIVGTSDQLRFDSFLESTAYRAYQLVFADGTLWDSVAMLAHATGLTLVGNTQNNELEGSVLDDSLSGLGGNDILWGEEGNDLLIGGVGNDTLHGGPGHDTYQFNLGDGIDTIHDTALSGEGNRIQFGAGITQSDLSFTRDEVARTLSIQVGNSGTDQLRLMNFDQTGANGSLAVQMLAFADGSVVNLADLFPTAVNHAPTLATPLADQTVQEDAPFNIVIPPTVFADQDAGDVLTLTANLADGSTLPAWLTFNAATATFSGMPDDAQVGILDLKVTATDSGNFSVSDVFALMVTNVNEAPTVVVPLANQTAVEDTAFTFVVPGSTFTDVDAGDVLTYSATLAGGAPLPSWLSFDPITRTFSGTPLNSNVDTLALTVMVTDQGNLSALTNFTLAIQNVNDAPTIAPPISDQTALEDTAFSFMVPVSTFTDVDQVHGDQLTYRASLAGNGSLPTWLSFDPITRTFSGTPGNADVGMLALTITAMDSGDLSVSTSFSLSVQNVNDAPTVAAPLADQTAAEDSPFSFTISGTTFTDADLIHGEVLVYGAALANGSPLPIWLSFNATTRSFSGIPGVGDAGTLQIAVTATDSGALSASDQFALVISGPLPRTLVGTAGNDMLTGGRGDDTLSGLAGNDTLTGGQGHDLLDGGTGTDTMQGGAGNDTYLVDASGDVVSELVNEGTDMVQSSMTYTLGAYVENLTLTGAANFNGTGNALDNILTGNSGINVLAGGVGNDTYVVGVGDTVVENFSGGTDTVVSSVTWTLGSNVENLTLTGTADINGTGGSANNTLLGNSGSNTLDGGSGNDTADGGDGHDSLFGGSGNDQLIGGLGNDVLNAGSGNDSLNGGDGIDTLDGGSGDDELLGGAGNDTLTGGSGVDQFTGGIGNDTLMGGSGNDRYHFLRGDGQDTIIDSDPFLGNQDRALFGATINPLDLVISRQANDLRLAIHGSPDQITVQNWYTSTSNRIETVQAGNGQALLSTQVDQLIQAMAGFTAQTGLTWDQAIDQRPQDVQTVLAASWQ